MTAVPTTPTPGATLVPSQSRSAFRAFWPGHIILARASLNDHDRALFAGQSHEVASAQQRNAHGLEVARSDVVKFTSVPRLWVSLFAFAKMVPRSRLRRRHWRTRSAFTDAGNGFGALDDIAEKLLPMALVVTQWRRGRRMIENKFCDSKPGLYVSVLHAAKKTDPNRPAPPAPSNFRDHQQPRRRIVRPAERAARPPVFKISLMSVPEALMAG